MSPKRPKNGTNQRPKRPNCPKQASEMSELLLSNSDMSLGIRTAEPYGSAAISPHSLIGRMTAAAETDRAAYPYGIATFVDEQGVVTTIKVTADRVEEALDRVRVRVFGARK